MSYRPSISKGLKKSSSKEPEAVAESSSKVLLKKKDEPQSAFPTDFSTPLQAMKDDKLPVKIKVNKSALYTHQCDGPAPSTTFHHVEVTKTEVRWTQYPKKRLSQAYSDRLDPKLISNTLTRFSKDEGLQAEMSLVFGKGVINQIKDIVRRELGISKRKSTYSSDVMEMRAKLAARGFNPDLTPIEGHESEERKESIVSEKKGLIDSLNDDEGTDFGDLGKTFDDDENV